MSYIGWEYTGEGLLAVHNSKFEYILSSDDEAFLHNWLFPPKGKFETKKSSVVIKVSASRVVGCIIPTWGTDFDVSVNVAAEDMENYNEKCD